MSQNPKNSLKYKSISVTLNNEQYNSLIKRPNFIPLFNRRVRYVVLPSREPYCVVRCVKALPNCKTTRNYADTILHVCYF